MLDPSTTERWGGGGRRGEEVEEGEIMGVCPPHD